MDLSLLFMSVRDFQYDVAISEIQEYEESLRLLYLSSSVLSYKKSICSIIIDKLYDEKIRWELNQKTIWIDSPVEILSNFYYKFEFFITIAPEERFENIFYIAYQTVGVLLERFV